MSDADSEVELYQKHCEETPIPPHRRRAAPISAELEELVLRCLEKEPNLRVQSAGELRDLLLTTPFATAWRAEDRSAWWGQYRVAHAAGGLAPQPLGGAYGPALVTQASDARV